MSPEECTSDWRHVGRDWSVGFSLFTVDQDLAFHEYGCNCLQVLLVEVEENNVLLLKLVLDVWSVEKALE